jgi:hypothetical protein
MSPLERAIARKMAPHLEPEGFSLKPSWNAFVRETDYGNDSVAIVNQGTAAPGPSHNQISVHCSVRHDTVEVPWNKLGLVYGEGQLQTATLILSLPRGLAAPKLKVFTQTKAADVERVANEGVAIFREVALGFYAHFRHLQKIEALANARPLEDISPFTIGLPMEHRAFRSLILAKLANPARYVPIREEFFGSKRRHVSTRKALGNVGQSGCT